MSDVASSPKLVAYGRPLNGSDGHPRVASVTGTVVSPSGAASLIGAPLLGSQEYSFLGAQEVPSSQQEEDSPRLNLPVDFRMQLQLLEMLGQQSRVMYQLYDGQNRMEQQLAKVESNVSRNQDLQSKILADMVTVKEAQRQTNQTMDQFISSSQCNGTPLRLSPHPFKLDAAHASHHIKNGDSGPIPPFPGVADTGGSATNDMMSQSPTENRSCAANSMTLWERAVSDSKAARSNSIGPASFTDEVESPTGIHGAGLVDSQTLRSHHHTLRLSSPDFLDGRVRATRDSLANKWTTTEGWLKMFDLFCGLVIAANAVTIGISAQESMVYALDHIGQGPGRESDVMRILGLVFLSVYILELSVKIWCTGCNFFFGSDWKWNIFDLVLVLFGLWEFIAEHLSLSATGQNLTWLRLLRLLKMMKMFRVVRLMRIFKVLRTMIQSIAGSLLMLFWAMLMLSLVMYMFGLCFIYGLSEHLLDTEPEKVADLLEDIEEYWGDIPSATITLYMAVTGGSDWEPLARPLKETSAIYYGIFLFYIAFSIVSALNVVTGMFVDAAMKISEQDEDAVVEEASDAPEVSQLGEYFKSLDVERTGFIDYKSFDSCMRLKPKELTNFMSRFNLEEFEVRQLFNRLCHMDKVDRVEFMAALLRVKGDMKGIDIVSLINDTRRQGLQLYVLMTFLEDTFSEIYSRFEMFGAPPSAVLPLKPRMQKYRCAPFPMVEGDRDDVQLDSHLLSEALHKRPET